MKGKGILFLVAVLLVVVLLAGTPACTSPATSPPATTPGAATPTASPTITPTSTTVPATSPSTQVFTLTANMGMVSKPYWVNSRYGTPLLEAIEQRSGGRIKFKAYYGAELFGAADEFKATDNGAVDFIPAWVPAYNINDNPVFGLCEVPFLFESGLHVWYTYNYTNLSQIFIQTVETKFPKVKLLNWGTSMFGRGTHLYYKGNDIKVPDDMKGLKFRATNALGKNYIDNNGGEGIFVAVSEAYLSLQRNIVNGAFGQNHSVVDAKWYEVTDKVTYLGIHNSQVVPVMNRARWDSLPADLQKMILDTCREYDDRASVVWSTDLDTVYVDMIKKARPDYKFIELTPDQKTAWRNGAKATWDYFISLVGPVGNDIIKLADSTRSDFAR